MNMSDTREAWYKERFDRRIVGDGLIKYGAKYWSDFSEVERHAVLEHVEDEEELYFGFYDSPEKWTMIGLVNVYSKHDGHFVTANLHNINGEMEPDVDPSLKNFKQRAIVCGFIILEVENKRIWVPEGPAIINLMSTLRYLTNAKYYNKRPD